MKPYKQPVEITYDSDANVLAWGINRKPIDFATEIGNRVVHFTERNIPVLIEILEASKFFFESRTPCEKEWGGSFSENGACREIKYVPDH